jgi:hypothetical protein
MSNFAFFDFQNRLINFCKPVWDASHEALGIGVMHNDFGELGNTII